MSQGLVVQTAAPAMINYQRRFSEFEYLHKISGPSLPTKRKHSHGMTQNIPGKQVLVRMHDCGKTNIIQSAKNDGSNFFRGVGTHGLIG